MEHVFRSIQSVLRTRPMDHRTDKAIRAHVFCSFLALVLLKELKKRMEEKRDLDELQRITMRLEGRKVRVRWSPVGDAGKAIQAVRVGLGPSVEIEG